jgi:hypothetical protein
MKRKKGSGDSSVNVYLRLWLTCLLLSASCCWRLYWLQISGMSLTFTEPHRLCLFRVLLGVMATVTSLPFCKHTGGGGTTPAFSGQRVYLQFHEGLPLTPSSVLRAPCPLCYMSFCCCCLLFSFFLFFSLGGGQSVQGAMLIWPRVVCGSTVCRLAHLVVCFFQAGRSWHLYLYIWWYYILRELVFLCSTVGG